MINSGGVKLQVESLERKVEHIFHDLGVTHRFFISSAPDEALGEKVILVIESINKLEILTSLDWSNYLDKYEIPKAILFDSSFKETPTGKINRNEVISGL